jgi:hypothetical protein
LWRNCLLLAGILLAPIVFSTGCDDDRSVHSYQAAKENSPPASPFGPGSSAGQTAAQPTDQNSNPPQTEIGWILPAGWKMLPPPTDPQARSMEVARIGVDDAAPTAMLTIVPLGGEGGELLPNVARWEGQLKLPVAKSDQDVQKVVKPLDTSFGKVPVVDLSSPPGSDKPQRVVAAAVPLQNFTVFATLRGPLDTISKQRRNFDLFIRSLRFTAASPDTSASSNSPPPNQPMGPPPPGPAQASSATPTFTTPADWVASPEKNDMRILGFSAGAALITVDRLPAGGMNNLIPLINMWRGQVGLNSLPDDAPVKPDEAQMIDGHLSTVFDMIGPSKDGGSKRLIVAMAAVGDEDWFIKLIGPADSVAKQQSAFMAFMRSIHFAGPPSAPPSAPAAGPPAGGG